jgi:hypothetical protein
MMSYHRDVRRPISSLIFDVFRHVWTSSIMFGSIISDDVRRPIKRLLGKKKSKSRCTAIYRLGNPVVILFIDWKPQKDVVWLFIDWTKKRYPPHSSAAIALPLLLLVFVPLY